MSDVPLTVGIRSNLISLKQTARLTDRTTGRLSTGKKVASAVDNPTNYFAAINYNDRANALTGRLDGMGEAIQQVKAADNGITSVRGFLTQMKGVVNDALANSDSDARKELGKQFNELIVQVRDLAKDSGYAGINLLYDNKSRTVQFNEKIGGPPWTSWASTSPAPAKSTKPRAKSTSPPSPAATTRVTP
jgi:flagellin-like hook-associated protein FlgL